MRRINMPTAKILTSAGLPQPGMPVSIPAPVQNPVKLTGTGGAAGAPNLFYGSVNLNSASGNYVGAWFDFGPDAGQAGAGHVSPADADFGWKVDITLDKSLRSKKIESVSMVSDVRGEAWSTSLHCDAINKDVYPLAIYNHGQRVNKSYGDVAGISGVPPDGKLDWQIYGQKGCGVFNGGRLIISFTDKTSVSIRAGTQADPVLHQKPADADTDLPKIIITTKTQTSAAGTGSVSMSSIGSSINFRSAKVLAEMVAFGQLAAGDTISAGTEVLGQVEYTRVPAGMKFIWNAGNSRWEDTEGKVITDTRILQYLAAQAPSGGEIPVNNDIILKSIAGILAAVNDEVQSGGMIELQSKIDTIVASINMTIKTANQYSQNYAAVARG